MDCGPAGRAQDHEEDDPSDDAPDGPSGGDERDRDGEEMKHDGSRVSGSGVAAGEEDGCERIGRDEPGDEHDERGSG